MPAASFKDLTGRTIGRWTVLTRASNTHDGSARWNCRCECGTERIVAAPGLHRRESLSCGCLKIENVKKACTKPPGWAGFAEVYREYQRNAAARGLAFTLTKPRALRLFLSPCAYCGAVESNTGRVRSGGGFRHNGIDRIDNSRGYVPSNVVPCCTFCNQAKHVHGLKDWMAWVFRTAINLLKISEEK